MSNLAPPFPSSDPVIDYYKQFVDRAQLRANLKLSVDERLQRLQRLAAELPPRHQPPIPDRPWEPISECGPSRTTDPIIELYKCDVDRTLLRENLTLTVDQRLQKLGDFVRFMQNLQAGSKRRGTSR